MISFRELMLLFDVLTRFQKIEMVFKHNKGRYQHNKKPTYKVFEFSFKTLKTMTAYSICIPRVFANIRWKRVKAVFDQLQLGEIDRVDMVQRTGDDGANAIHISSVSDGNTDETI